jgi:diguanylate cyclase (GGDEF)-like protein
MRPLALLGVVLSLLLIGVSVFSTVESASNRRNVQDRALEEAVASQVERVLGSIRQMHAVSSQMLVNPDVGGLVEHPRGAARARDLAGAREALASFKRAALLPLSSACVDDATGRELACVPNPRIAFPATVDRQLATLAAASPMGGSTKAFLSPLTLRPTVAFVAPLRNASGLHGLAHFDIDVAYIESSRMLVDNIPGVQMTLGGYEDGSLILPGDKLRRVSGALVPRGPFSAIDRGPWSVVRGGHREMVAVAPLMIADRDRELAVIAHYAAANPTLLNAWGPGALVLLVLALLTLVGSIAALASANRRMRSELATDPLTRLRNRRALMEDLPRACLRASETQPAYLWLFDLNGFKHYNDSFGHLAGDALLARLGHRLEAAMSAIGAVYRLGGDEFCVLVTGTPSDPLASFERAREALSERGPAFSVTASAGAVELPRDAREPTAALRLADQHMYRDKAASKSGAAELVTAVLHEALAQRHPELDEHSSDVACDVEVLARSIGLDEEAVEMIIRAGDLHDVGKLGIPDEIITKPGPLNEREWQFMRQHTVMGERIIAAAGPSLERIAPLVRASHERWDGKGYPDGLVGERIPLGARIITICDSFRAMLSARPYKRAMSMQEATAELRRCAGSQFDPELVEIFCKVLAERSAPERLV